MVKVIGQSSRSLEKNVAEMVGATLSDGFSSFFLFIQLSIPELP